MDTRDTYRQPLITAALHFVRWHVSTKTVSLWQKLNGAVLPFPNFTLPKKVNVISTVC